MESNEEDYSLSDFEDDVVGFCAFLPLRAVTTPPQYHYSSMPREWCCWARFVVADALLCMHMR